MSVKNVKILIALSQVGSIWSKNRTEIKILKSLTAIGFLALFFKSEEKEKQKDEINKFNQSKPDNYYGH